MIETPPTVPVPPSPTILVEEDDDDEDNDKPQLLSEISVLSVAESIIDSVKVSMGSSLGFEDEERDSQLDTPVTRLNNELKEYLAAEGKNKEEDVEDCNDEVDLVQPETCLSKPPTIAPPPLPQESLETLKDAPPVEKKRKSKATSKSSKRKSKKTRPTKVVRSATLDGDISPRGSVTRSNTVDIKPPNQPRHYFKDSEPFNRELVFKKVKELSVDDITTMKTLVEALIHKVFLSESGDLLFKCVDAEGTKFKFLKNKDGSWESDNRGKHLMSVLSYPMIYRLSDLKAAEFKKASPHDDVIARINSLIKNFRKANKIHGKRTSFHKELMTELGPRISYIKK